VFFAFDVLRIGNESLVRQPLEARRGRLRLAVLGSSVLLSEPLPGSPERIEREIRKFGLEGIVAKRRDSIYARRAHTRLGQGEVQPAPGIRDRGLPARRRGVRFDPRRVLRRRISTTLRR
jgi:hypothetical protein